MNSEIFIDYTNTSRYSDLVNSIETLINQKPKFKFLLVDIEETNNTNPLVKHPNIFSTESVINGDCQLHLHFIETDEKRLSDKIFNNPTWKDILTEINNLLTYTEVADLHNLEIQGVLMSGDGYHVGALITLNYA